MRGNRVNKDTGQSPVHICLRRLDCLCLIRADSRRTCEAHQRCTLGLALDHRNVTTGIPDTSRVWAVALKHGGRPPALCIIDVEFVPGTQNIHAPDTKTQTVDIY